MSLDGAADGVSVPLSAAASRSLLFFVASSDTRLFREGAAGASWASGLAGWLAGKGVSGVVAHASSNKVALQRGTEFGSLAVLMGSFSFSEGGI